MTEEAWKASARVIPLFNFKKGYRSMRWTIIGPEFQSYQW